MMNLTAISHLELAGSPAPMEQRLFWINKRSDSRRALRQLDCLRQGQANLGNYEFEAKAAVSY